jgi:hypothetical protein
MMPWLAPMFLSLSDHWIGRFRISPHPAARRPRPSGRQRVVQDTCDTRVGVMERDLPMPPTRLKVAWPPANPPCQTPR